GGRGEPGEGVPARGGQDSGGTADQGPGAVAEVLRELAAGVGGPDTRLPDCDDRLHRAGGQGRGLTAHRRTDCQSVIRSRRKTRNGKDPTVQKARDGRERRTGGIRGQGQGLEDPIPAKRSVWEARVSFRLPP